MKEAIRYPQIIILICILALAVISSCGNVTCDRLENSYGRLMRNLETKSDTLTFIGDLVALTAKQRSCLKAHQVLGSLYIATDQWAKAKEALLVAEQLEPLNSYTCYHLGMVYRSMHKGDTALSFLIKALMAKNQDGRIYNTNNDFFRNLDIDYSTILYLTGLTAYEQGELSISKQFLLNYGRDGADLKDTYCYLAAIYARENKMDSACYYFYKNPNGNFPDIGPDSLFKICGPALNTLNPATKNSNGQLFP